MSVYLFLKASMIWFIMAIFAVINGMIRENIFVPYLGEANALPISGISLSIIIFTITYLSFDLFGKNGYLTNLYIGIQWVAMTLIFEFVFGHYAMGKSWLELLQVFNLLEGNLFIVALLVTFFSPIVVALIKKHKQ